MRETERAGGRSNQRTSIPITNTDGQSDQCSIKQKRSMVFIPEVNGEFICAARAIVTCLAVLEGMAKKDFKSLIHKKNTHSNAPTSQRIRALKLHRDTNIDITAPISLTKLPQFERHLKVQIIVVSGDLGSEIIYRGCEPRPGRQIFLYLKDNHFHSITNIKGFFHDKKLCQHCLTLTPKRSLHVCEHACGTCGREDCVKADDSLTCEDCNKFCRNSQCYLAHKMTRQYTTGRLKGQDRLSLCDTFYKCVKCCKVFDRMKRSVDDHKCGEWFCRCCQNYVMDDHLCYYKCRKPYHTTGRFIIYDFETNQSDYVVNCAEGYNPQPQPDCQDCNHETQCQKCRLCTNCKRSYCGYNRHIPNYAVSQTVCDKCKNDEFSSDSMCDYCGDRCTLCCGRGPTGFIKPPCQNGKCGQREKIFQGFNTAFEFSQWLISPQHSDMVCIAHNSKNFDTHFILNYCVDNGIFPEIIFQGTKVMSMKIKEIQLRFIDSINFLPFSLKKVAKLFDLEVKKGYFPHFVNKESMYNYCGPLPQPEAYGVDYMSSEDRAEFFTWYESQKFEVFDYQQVLEEYAKDDVNILRESCTQFRDLLMEITTLENSKVPGVDPFAHTTIASCSMQIIRQLMLYEIHKVELIDGRCGTGIVKRGNWTFEGSPIHESMIKSTEFIKSPIPQIPARGYCKDIKNSEKCFQWLKWVSHITKRNIQHGRCGGEYRVPGTKYHLDGFYEEVVNGKTVMYGYEFLGCYWHGCPCLEERFKLKDPHTHQSFKALHQTTMLRLKEIADKGYILIIMRECQFEIMKKHPEIAQFLSTCTTVPPLQIRDAFQGGRVETFQLFKQVSDDETIQYYDVISLYPSVLLGQYPCCHPVRITNPADFDYSLKSHFGLIKLKILPPRKLFIPVLGIKNNDKLKFVLCFKCGDSENTDECQCSDSERALVGTWTTVEVSKAMSVGYKIQEIFEIYHYRETTTDHDSPGGVFFEYFQLFLKIKSESSGYPEGIDTDQAKEAYIKYYHENQGILLDKDKIVYNPALRLIAKIFCNSAWGKLTQRENMTKTAYVKTQCELSTLRNDPHKIVTDFHLINENFLVIEYHSNDNFVEDPTFQNLVYGIFTTSWGRVKLLEILQKTDRNTLYADTDSVIFVEKKGSNTLPLGNLLGDLSSELPTGSHIDTFISSGPKSYAYKLDSGASCVKIKGITLNHVNSQHINFTTIRDIITGKIDEIKLPKFNQISRVKHHGIIYNRPTSKVFRKIFTKRQVNHENYISYPYGF